MKFDKADAARALEQEQAVRDLVTQIEKASSELAEIAPELFRTNAAYGVFRRLGRAAEAQADFLAAAMAGMQRCNELPVAVFNGCERGVPRDPGRPMGVARRGSAAHALELAVRPTGSVVR